MCSRIFGLDENDEIDEILSIDNIDHQFNRHRHHVTSETTALPTPTITIYPKANNPDSTVESETQQVKMVTIGDQLSINQMCYMLDESFEVHGYEYTDSAVGTESQLSNIGTAYIDSLTNRINRQTTDGNSGNHGTRSPAFLFSQDMFSQYLGNHSMDITTSDGYRRLDQPNDHVRHDSMDYFDNLASTSDGSTSTQRQVTNDSSLAKRSFHSLMQRSIMKDLDLPCSSIHLALITPNETQAHPDEEESFLQFFNNRTLSGIVASPNFNNLSQEFAASGNVSGSNRDALPHFGDSQHDIQSENLLRTRSSQEFFRQFTKTLSRERNHFDDQSQVQLSPNRLPQSILDLHEQVIGSGLSDWSFVYALSAQACQELMPMTYNVTLKISLLLSIASIDTKKDVVPIPIVAFGRESSAANSIMKHMGNFAQRFLAPTDHTFNVMVNSDKTVEIGPVFLAKNGVCYLGDWSGLSKKISEEIKILIDSGRFFLNETSENFQLGSALWTYWSSMNNKKDFTNAALFIKYFGIPIMTDTIESNDIIEFLLLEARDGKVEIPNDVLNISSDDMKIYLNIVRKINVRKTDEAQQLLKAYSDTIQRDREGLLSVRSFQVIQQMAESFAKLSLRENVLVCDVVGAISIAEKTFYAITGLARAPLLPPTQDIEMVDQYIQAFHNWISSYLTMF